MKNSIQITLLILFISGALLARDIKETSANKHFHSIQQSDGLTPADIKNPILTDSYTSKKSGVTHFYYKQQIDGIAIENATMNIHIMPDNSVLYSRSQFIKDAKSLVVGKAKGISASSAVQIAAGDLQLVPINLSILSNKGNLSTFSEAGIAFEPIKAEKMYLHQDGKIVPTWKVGIYTEDTQHYWETYVNVNDGSIVEQRDAVIHCNFGTPDVGDDCANHAHKYDVMEEDLDAQQFGNGMAGTYRALPLRVESPTHGSRVLLTNPDDPATSPFGWHDTNGANGAEYTITRGNNVLAHEDQNGNNGIGASPSGGAALVFDFPLNLNLPPASNLDNNTTNLFVWNNFTHDVWHHYGFDEPSGNFQQNNYGNGGAAGDPVDAQCQDGSGSNNANFFTPSDGSDPRMQMFLWTAPNPDRDGDLDNGIIVHEYGHGISIRLTGGPNSSCLSNTEQMGEGWSDWFGLVMTQELAHTKNTPRGIGTYALAQPTSGAGIRPTRYTHDMSINPSTYNTIKQSNIPAPHGVGYVWCTMIWDLYWDLIDVHGFDADMYTGTGGNNIAMNLVIEGCKLQGCSPGFVSGRDAIIAADQALYGGANNCTIWAAFARRGLGYSANQGSTASKTDGTEAFDTPPGGGPGSATITKTADKTTAAVNEVITYTLGATGTASACSGGGPAGNVNVVDNLPAELTYVAGSASNGGSHSNGVITWTIPASTSPTNLTYQATVNSVPPSIVFEDDMESGGAPEWMISNEATNPAGSTSNWRIQAGTPCGSSSFYAEELEASPGGGANYYVNQYLDVPVGLTADAILTFDHFYDTEDLWDGGTVEISTNGGTSWTDLGNFMTSNGYNSSIANSTIPGFAGLAPSCLTTEVDLASFSNCESAIIRFNFYYDPLAVGTVNNIPDGWYVDNVEVNAAPMVINSASATLGTSTDVGAVCVEIAGTPPPTCCDLSPILTVVPSNIVGISAIGVAVEITELSGNASDPTSPLKVRMPYDPRLNFSWDPTLSNVAFKPVQNGEWSFLGNNGIVYEFQYNLTIPANGRKAFGFNGIYNPQGTEGLTTITATVFPFSGGECDATNNTDAEIMIYFD